MPKDFIQFYGEHKISPVRQDLSNYNKHVERRKELYKHLGLLPFSFQGKDIIEVGPGGGYNSLVIADWNPNKYVLVEANETGIEDIKRNFKNHPIIQKGNLQIINKRLENIYLQKKFDIVLCEQMIPHNSNQEKLLNKLDGLTREGGVLVLTCIDEISSYFEIMKRYFGAQLVKGKTDFEDKTKTLVDALGSHKKTLTGSSRFDEDWVIDNFLNESVFNPLFSIKDCINFFNNNFKIYNTSPKIFTDYRWFKRIPEDNNYNQDCLSQFDKIKHNFFYTEKIFEPRDKEQNEELSELCKDARKMTFYYEFRKKDVRKNMNENIKKIIKNIGYLDKDILGALKDIKKLNNKKILTVEDLGKNCPNFMKAFGKCSQYISLIKLIK